MVALEVVGAGKSGKLENRESEGEVFEYLQSKVSG